MSRHPLLVFRLLLIGFLGFLTFWGNAWSTVTVSTDPGFVEPLTVARGTTDFGVIRVELSTPAQDDSIENWSWYLDFGGSAIDEVYLHRVNDDNTTTLAGNVDGAFSNNQLLSIGTGGFTTGTNVLLTTGPSRFEFRVDVSTNAGLDQADFRMKILPSNITVTTGGTPGGGFFYSNTILFTTDPALTVTTDSGFVEPTTLYGGIQDYPLMRIAISTPTTDSVFEQITLDLDNYAYNLEKVSVYRVFEDPNEPEILIGSDAGSFSSSHQISITSTNSDIQSQVHHSTEAAFFEFRVDIMQSPGVGPLDFHLDPQDILYTSGVSLIDPAVQDLSNSVPFGQSQVLVTTDVGFTEPITSNAGDDMFSVMRIEISTPVVNSTFEKLAVTLAQGAADINQVYLYRVLEDNSQVLIGTDAGSYSDFDNIVFNSTNSSINSQIHESTGVARFEFKVDISGFATQPDFQLKVSRATDISYTSNASTVSVPGDTYMYSNEITITPSSTSPHSYYGPLAADGGIDSVEIGYGQFSSTEFSFLARVNGDHTNISQIEFTTPGYVSGPKILLTSDPNNMNSAYLSPFFASDSGLTVEFPNGAYEFTITKTDTSTHVFQTTVSGISSIYFSGPDVPSIIQPTSGASISSTTPYTIEWGDLSGSSGHFVRVDITSDQGMLLDEFEGLTNTTSFGSINPLSVGANYLASVKNILHHSTDNGTIESLSNDDFQSRVYKFANTYSIFDITDQASDVFVTTDPGFAEPTTTNVGYQDFPVMRIAITTPATDSTFSKLEVYINNGGASLDEVSLYRMFPDSSTEIQVGTQAGTFTNAQNIVFDYLNGTINTEIHHSTELAVFEVRVDVNGSAADPSFQLKIDPLDIVYVNNDSIVYSTHTPLYSNIVGITSSSSASSHAFYGDGPTDGNIEVVEIGYGYDKTYGEYEFYARFTGDLTNITTITFTTPGGIPADALTLIKDTGNTSAVYWSENDYFSLASMLTDFPTGDYVFEFTNGGTHNITVTVPGSLGAPPTAPADIPNITIPTDNASLTLSPPPVFQWDDISTNTVIDFLRVEVEDQGTFDVLEEKDLGKNAITYTMTSSLVPSTNYEVLVSGVVSETTNSGTISTMGNDNYEARIATYGMDSVPFNTSSGSSSGESIVVTSDPNSPTPTSLASGFSTHIFNFIMNTTTGSAAINSFSLSIAQGTASDIQSIELQYFDGTTTQVLAGAASGTSVNFGGGINVNTTPEIFEVHVTIVASPTSSTLQFTLNPSTIATTLGAASGDSITTTAYAIGSSAGGAHTEVVTDYLTAAEINPAQAQIGVTTSFTVDIMTGVTGDAVGFNVVGVEWPISIGTPTNIALSTSIDGGTTYNTTANANYTETINTTNFTLVLNSTETSSSVKYRVAFDATPQDADPNAQFGVALLNSSHQVEFFPFPGDVDGVLNNDWLEVSTYGVGNGQQVLVAAEAEVLPKNVTFNTSQNFTVFAKATPNSTDAGFDRMRIELPFFNAIPTVSTVNVNGVTASLNDTVTDHGYILLKFSSAQTGLVDVDVSFSVQLPEFGPNLGAFGVSFDNTANLNPTVAFWGDANSTPGDNDTLEVYLLASGGGGGSTFASSDAVAEVNPSQIQSNSTGSLTFTLKTTMAGSDAFSFMSVGIPDGFVNPSNVTVKTNGVAQTNGTDVTIDTNNASQIGITFNSSQSSSKTYEVKMNITAPEIPTRVAGEERFNIKLNNYTVSPGDTQVYTTGSGSLRVQGYLPIQSTPVVSGLIAEIGASSTLSPDDFAYLETLVQTTVSGSDAGFNVLSIALPGGFSQISGVYVETNSGALNSGFDYTSKIKSFPAKKFIDIKFTNTQTSSEVYKVSFNVQTPQLPGRQEVGVLASNTSNWRPKNAQAGQANFTPYPVYFTPRGSLELHIQSTSFGSEPNADSVVAEVGSEGTLFAGQLGEFNMYFKPTLSGSQSVNLIHFEVPFGFSEPGNIILSSGAGSSASAFVSGVDYDVHPGYHPGAVDIVLTTPLDSSNSEQVYTISFESGLPFEGGFYYFNMGVDNTNALFFTPGYDGDAYSSESSNSLEVDVDVTAATGENVDDLKFEIGPNSNIGTSSHVELNMYFKIDITTSAQKGFDIVKIFYPFDFGEPSGIAFSSSASSSGTFSEWSGSDFQTDTSEPGSLKLTLTTAQTYTTSDGGYYKVSFAIATSDFSGEKYFDMLINNKTNLLPHYGSPADVHSDESNNDNRINVIHSGEYLGSNVNDLVAEADTFPLGFANGFEVNTSTSATFGILVQATVGSADQGFNFIGLEYPFDLTVGASSISVTDYNTGNLLTKDTDYTLQTDDGFIGITLLTAVSAPGSGETKSRFLVKFTGTSPAYEFPAYFNAYVENSSNPSPFYARPGNAEATATPGDSLKRNDLVIPIIAGSDAATGHSLEELAGELELVSTQALANTDVEVNFIIQSTAGSASGFDIMEILLPPGFTKSGTVSISTDSGTTTLTSGYTATALAATTFDPAKIKITFDSVQKDVTYQINMKIKTPTYSTFGYFDVEVKNKALIGSEFFAYWADVDGDGAFGTMEMFTSVAAGSGTNVTDLLYEVTVTTENGGQDLGVIDADSTPVWQVFIKPTISGSDQGFNLVRLELPFYLGDTNPSDVIISTASTTDITTKANWTALTKNVGYELFTDDPNVVAFKLSSAVTSTSHVIVSFKKQVTPYPDFMSVFASVDNTSNSVPTHGFFGDADGGYASSRNDGGFPVAGSFSTTQNVTSVSAEVVTSGTIQTDSTANFSIYMNVQVSSGESGWNQVKAIYPFDLTNIKVSTISTGDTVAALSALSSSKYTLDTSIEGELSISLSGDAVTTTKIVKIDVQANTPPFPIFAFVDVEVDNSTNYNPFFAFEDDVNGDSSSRLSFDIIPSYSFDSLSPVLNNASMELITVPESGSTIQTLTQPKMSVIVKAEMTDTTVTGFDIFRMVAPPGFTMPTSASAFTVYRTTSTSTIDSSTQKLTLNSDYKVDVNNAAFGEIKIKFTTVQNTTNVTDFTSSQPLYYRVEFKPTAPEFDSFGFMDMVVTNQSNPLDFFPAWANLVTGGTDLYTSDTTVIDRNGMDVEVSIPFDTTAAPNLTDLQAEINTASTLSADGKAATFTVTVKPKLSTGDVGFDRIGVHIPFGFTSPTNIAVTKTDSATSTSSSINFQSEFKTDLSVALIKLTDKDTDTNEHYYTITFQSKTPDFPIGAYFDVAVFSKTNPFPFFAIPADVDGVSTNTNGLFLDVLPNINLGSIGGTGGFSFTPLADQLTVEVSPNKLTAGTTKQDISVYVKATNISGQQGFDILQLFLPPDMASPSAVKVYVSTNSGTFSTYASGAGLKSSPSATNGVLKILFSNVIGNATTNTVKVTFQSDAPTFPTQVFVDAEVDKSTNPLPHFAFPGDADTASSTNDNIIFVEPDFTSIDFSKRPLTKLHSEIAYSSAVVGETATLSYYIYVEKTASDSGFDLMEFFVPFEFGSPNNIKISSAPYSATLSATSFTQLAPTTNYKLTDTDPYNFKVKLQSGSKFTSTTPHVYKVTFTADAPPFPDIFFFGMRLLDTSNPGLDMFPTPEDVVGETLAPNNNMEVKVKPGSSFDATKLPAQFAETEIYPNTAPANTTNTFTIASKITIADGDSGFNKFKILLPPSFGKASKVSANIPNVQSSRDLIEDLEYKVSSTDGQFTVTLTTPVTTTGIHYTTLSFAIQTSKFAGFDFFDMLVSNTTNPVEVFAGWGDINTSNGDGTMNVNVYPNFTGPIVIKNPADTLIAEVKATPKSGSSIIVSTSVHVDVFIRATSSSSDTIGFDQLGLFIPPEFGAPSNYSVKLSVSSASTNYLVKDTHYTLINSDPYTPKINFTSTFGTQDMTIGFDIDTPEFPTGGFFDVFINSSSFPNKFFPMFGVDDLNGDTTDGNSMEVLVLPDLTQPVSTEYVADGAIAETNTATSILAGGSGEVTLAVKVDNSGGIGFNRLKIELPDFLTSAGVNSVTKDGTAMVLSTDYTVDSSDTHAIRLKFESTQSSTAGSTTYLVKFKVQAPTFPVTAYLEVLLQNSTLHHPIHSHWGDANATASDNDGLFFDIIPDRSVFTEAELAKDNLTKLISEAVIVDTSGEGKEVEATTSATVRMYIKPEFETDNRGVDLIKIFPPFEFGTPSNLVIYTSSSDVSSRVALGEYVDYNKSISSSTKEIEIKLTTAVHYITNSTHFQVEFTATMPEVSSDYFIDASADNKTFSIPNFTEFGDINNDADDDNDGTVNGLGDNHTFLRVVPKEIANFDSLVNVSNVEAEIVSTASGEVGSTATVVTAIKTSFTATDSGINRIFFKLPVVFTSLANFSIAKAENGGSLTTMNLISDYKVDLSNPENVAISLITTTTSDTIYYTTFTSLLPSIPQAFEFKVGADNSSTPKLVEAKAADVDTTQGSNELSFKVKPAAVVITENTKEPLTAIKARINSPAQMSVSKTTNVTAVVTVDVDSTNNIGFDVLRVESADFTGISNFTISTSADSGTTYTTLLKTLDYKTFTDATGVNIIFSTAFTSNIVVKLTYSVTAGAKPGLGRFNISAANKTLPFNFEAKVDNSVVDASTGRKGQLGVNIVPARKSAAELTQAPQTPVSSLYFEITPTTGTAGEHVSLVGHVKATINTSSDSGFNQLFIDIPTQLGTVSNISLSYKDAATGTYKLYTNIKHYKASQVSGGGRLTYQLQKTGTDLFTTSGTTKTADLRIGFTALMPTVADSYFFDAGVDNSLSPLTIIAAPHDVNGDDSHTTSLKVVPNASVLANIANFEVVESVVAELTPATVKTSASQNFDVYLKAIKSSTSHGFNSIGVGLPFDFESLSNIKVSTLISSSTVATQLTNLTDYEATVDTLDNIIKIDLNSVVYTSSSTSDVIYKVSFTATAPPFTGPFSAVAGVFNRTLGLGVDVTAGNAHDNSSTNDMGIHVLLNSSSTTTAKSGFFGEIGYTSIFGASGSWRGLVRVGVGSGFSSSIAASTDSTNNILLQTTPVFDATAPGFDYMNIDLPYGAGKPSNVTVFYRTTEGGTNTYLQEHYNYKTSVSTGRLILKFKDENGLSSPINSTSMGTNSLFYVNFDMPMPKEIGKHFFDAWALNTTQTGDKYFIEPVLGSRSTSTTIIGRDADSDGTRHLAIEVTNPSATPVIAGLVAEITGSESRLPVNAVRTLTLNVATTLAAGESFDNLEIQLPEGFSSVSDLSVDRAGVTLHNLKDFTLNTSHPRSFGLVFASAETTSAVYTLRFSIRTPSEVTGISSNLTYKFGVVASLASTSTVQSKHRVFATPGDVTATNASNSLSVAVGADRLISGTITFSEPLKYKTFVRAELYDLDKSGALVPTGLAVSVAQPAGTTKVPYSISQQFRDTQIAGLQDGNYQVKLLAAGYQTQTLGTSASPISIVGGKSLTGQNVTMTPNDVQSVINMTPSSTIKPGTNSTWTLQIHPTFHNTETGIKNFIYSMTKNQGVGDFTAFTPVAVRIDGLASTLTVTTSGSDTVVDTTGFTNANSLLEIDFNVVTGATQDALYIINTTLTGLVSSGTFPAYPQAALDSVNPRTLLNVGTSPIRFIDPRTVDTVLGQQFSKQILTFSSTVSTGAMNFSQTGLPSGINMNSSGLVSGVPSSLSSTGFPFKVRIDYATATTSTSGTQTVVTSNAGTLTGDFLLIVRRTNYSLYSIQPLAIPVEGGEIVMTGFGFTDSAKVSVGSESTVTNGTDTAVTYVSTSKLVVKVPAMAAGEYYLKLSDTGDDLYLPNVLNDSKLVVAEKKAFTATVSAQVDVGQSATVLDYDIIGIQNFYQGSVRDMLVAAFGTYDINNWRVFGYESGKYFELNEKPSGDTASLRAGTGFWHISRVDGTISAEGVSADTVGKYTVVLDGESWTLVTNLFTTSVTWADVGILAGDLDSPVSTTVGAADNSYVNITLWGMDKSSSDLVRPYKPMGSLQPGMGYWVYNKDAKPVTLKISKESGSVVSKAKNILYKPEENEPPEAPVNVQESASGSAAAGGGGGGCFLQ